MHKHSHAHPADHHDGHSHSAHTHTHGVVDPRIASTARGIWAIKWSFVVLAATALLQVVVVLLSGSVALLADTIHNFGDVPQFRCGLRSGSRVGSPASGSPMGMRNSPDAQFPVDPPNAQMNTRALHWRRETCELFRNQRQGGLQYQTHVGLHWWGVNQRNLGRIIFLATEASPEPGINYDFQCVEVGRRDQR